MSEAEEHDEQEIVPRIVVLGAGPIGLEAALYGRYLGYEVAIVEKGRVANNVQRWGHVKMFSPFAMNRSPLGMAALQAQFADRSWPDDDAMLTGKEYLESYLLPLSQSDLLAGCVHEKVEVLSVARDGILKTDLAGSRAEYTFRVLVLSSAGEDVIDADYVIDTTGVLDLPNPLGHGGQPAIGESEACPDIWHGVPNILGTDRSQFAGQRILLVGNGYSAATCVVALAELKQQAAETETTWLTRREAPPAGPMPLNHDDKLAERLRLSENANQAVASGAVRHFDQCGILAVAKTARSYCVRVGGKLLGEHEFDQIVSCTGYRPRWSLLRELQVDVCERSEAPRAAARWFGGLGTVDAIDQVSPGVEAWRTTEPNFFVLGSKSFGRNSNFLLSLGLQQIRDVFTLIADRRDLDLYQTMQG